MQGTTRQTLQCKLPLWAGNPHPCLTLWDPVLAWHLQNFQANMSEPLYNKLVKPFFDCAGALEADVVKHTNASKVQGWPAHKLLGILHHSACLQAWELPCACRLGWDQR